MYKIKIELPDSVQYIIRELLLKGFGAFVVGGCVRDSILGRPIHDWDITTSAKPEDIKKIFSKYNIVETGIKHGTVTLILDDIGYEITTYRADGKYLDNRHPETITYVDSLVEDLSRRDFTINAMAYNDETGLVDPFYGKRDLENKIIRCVGRPYDRFNEDALRMMRALRFAAQLDFKIDEEIKDNIRRLEKNILNVSKERITEEFKKLICCSNGYAALSVLFDYQRFFALLFPPIYDMFGFKQNNRYHKYDVWLHSLYVLSYTQNDFITRCAALFHDIGKPHCYSEDTQGEGHFYKHPEVSYEIFEKICEDRYLILSNEERYNIGMLIRYHDCFLSNDKNIIRRSVFRLGNENFLRFLDLKDADFAAHIFKPEYGVPDWVFNKEDVLNTYKQILNENGCMSFKKLALNGYDLINLKFEGKIIGTILSELLDLVIDEKIENDKDILLDYVKEKYRN